MEADRVFAAAHAKPATCPCAVFRRTRFVSHVRFSDQIYVTGHPATWPPKHREFTKGGWWSESPRAFSSDPTRCSNPTLTLGFDGLPQQGGGGDQLVRDRSAAL